MPSRTTTKILAALAGLYVVSMVLAMLVLFPMGCAHTREVKASTGHDNVIPAKHSARDARHRLVAPLPEVPCA